MHGADGNKGARRRRTLEPAAPPPFNPDETRVIRPRPGGRRVPAPPLDDAAPPPVPAPAPTPVPAAEVAVPASGDGGTMLPFAMPLLQLLARLRTLAGEADPAALRDRTEAELRNFEARATAAGVPPDLVRRGQYALCDSLDDAVLNTPWGARGPWAARPMTAALHPGVGPGRFFDALRQAESRVATMRPVLELMVLCLSLGTAGPYRTRPDGAAELESLRAAAVATLLAHTPPAPAALSADWTGIDAPVRRRHAVRLPVWVAGSAVLAAVAGLFLLLDRRLNGDGDALFARMLAAPPASMPAIAREPAPAPPPPPPAAEPTVADRLRTRLDAQGAAGAVAVAGTPAIPVLRLPEQALFAPGTATFLPGAPALLDAVAAALKPEGGRLRVLGYADNRPVRTVAFPSAFKLTAARAEAVRAALSPLLAGTAITAEGRGPADPAAPNTTPEGRAGNRRVEVVLDGAAP